MEEYHVENFGCRASRADGDAIASQLHQAGLSEAKNLATADVVVLNTCSVTAEADRSARAYLRKVRRTTPGAKVVFTGCYAQRVPEEVAALDGVRAVIGNSHKSRVADVVLSLIGAHRSPAEAFVPVGDLLAGRQDLNRTTFPVLHDSVFAHSGLADLPFASDTHRTRPNLKIQDGCGNRCSFCIIPVTRGASRSVSFPECLRAVTEFAQSSGKELVLSGINLGRWGRDLSPVSRFEDLVAGILQETRLSRLRISSVEPMDWSPELIMLFRHYGQDSGGDGPRLARHAHLPLQSGSDTILRAMHRRYRPWHYAGKVEAIRAAAPDAAIGADVMIGFPGETDALFQETYDFIEGLPVTYLHVFPFSARPGTVASRLHSSVQVHGAAVNERKKAIMSLISSKNRAFRQRFVNRELSVVTLAGTSSEITEAMSDNFLSVQIKGVFPSNLLLRIRVTALTEAGLCGDVLPAS